MYIGAYVFTQITQFLPQRQFRRIVAKYEDRTKGCELIRKVETSHCGVSSPPTTELIRNVETSHCGVSSTEPVLPK